ncbi:MAG: DUF1328 domain-containing protein [Flavobacteriales bacterium]|nr:DUF1328 domain-containing protein [Flavobacteriales bacterium]
MLRWVVTFIIIALIAGVLGFTNIAAGAADIIKKCCSSCSSVC